MDEQQQELPLEEQQQQASAEFAAGYNKVRGIESPTSTPAEAAPEQPADEPTPKEVPTDEPIFAGLTVSELKAKLDRIDEIDNARKHLEGETRKIHGRFGELNSALQQIQTARPGQFSPAKLKRLQEEYPDLAEVLAEDLGDVFAQGGEPVDVDARVNERVQSVKAEFEEKLLTLQHPDWRELPATPEFQAWGQTMPPNEFAALMDSMDGLTVARALSTFKSWREEQRKQTKTPDPDEGSRRKQDKRARLEAAVIPQNGAAPPSGEKDPADSFRAGYNRVARARQF